MSNRLSVSLSCHYVSPGVHALCVKVEPEHLNGKQVYLREVGGRKLSVNLVQTEPNFEGGLEIQECLAIMCQKRVDIYHNNQ